MLKTSLLKAILTVLSRKLSLTEYIISELTFSPDMMSPSSA